MPFTGEKRRVAAVKALGDGDLLERDMVLVRSGGELTLRVIAPGYVVSHAGPRRILAGHQTGTRGRAHRAGRVALCEPHAPGGQTVNVRRLVKRFWIVGADVHESHVVGEENDDVGFHLFDGGVRGGCASERATAKRSETRRLSS